MRLYCVMDEREFEQLAAGLRKKAITTCLSCGADAMQAEDVAQDVLLRLWQMHDSLDRYRSLEALVTVMARNEVVSQHRTKRTIPLSDISASLLHSNLGNADQEFISAQEMAWLTSAMRQLPGTQYAVLHMRQVEHRSYDEIAQLLGIESSSARSLLSRARMWLLHEIKNRDK